MGIYGGLKAEDVRRWGQLTTFKTNAAALLRNEVATDQIIYCSPLVDPYQPAEAQQQLMPEILDVLRRAPPRIFVIQTRSPLILRDLSELRRLSSVTTLRISFSVTTNRDDVRRRYEPRCESNDARLAAIQALREAGLEAYATLAPLLPCNPERLAEMALQASERTLIGDALHTRSNKARGATTRPMAFEIAHRFGDESWFLNESQLQTEARIREVARKNGFDFATGPPGFGVLAREATIT
jgi:DNA repair photolyase